MSRRKFREDKSKFFGTKQVLQNLNQTAHASVHDLDPAVAGASNYRGPWSSSTAYAPGNLVTYGGNLYLAILAVGPSGTVPPDDPTHWIFFAHSSTTSVGRTQVFIGGRFLSGTGSVNGGRNRSGRFEIPGHAQLYTQDDNAGFWKGGIWYDAAGGAGGNQAELLLCNTFGASDHIRAFNPKTGKYLRIGGGTLSGYQPMGIVRIGSTLYEVAQKFTDDNYYLRRHNQSDLAFTTETDITSATFDPGAIFHNVGTFTDGTNISIVTAINAGVYRVFTVDTAGAAVGSSYDLPAPWNPGGGTLDTYQCYYDIANDVLYTVSEGVAATPLVYAYDLSTRTRRPELEWVHASGTSEGVSIAYGGGQFYHVTGSHDDVKVGAPTPLPTTMSVGDIVYVKQAIGPYVGKGTLHDEFAEEMFQAVGVVTTAGADPVITVHWHSDIKLYGNYAIEYDIPG